MCINFFFKRVNDTDEINNPNETEWNSGEIYTLGNNYTYVRVEYISMIAPVEVDYDEAKEQVTLQVEKPSVSIPFGVVGYSKLLKVNEINEIQS